MNDLLSEYNIPHPQEELRGGLKGQAVQTNSTARTQAAMGFDSTEGLTPTGMVISRSDNVKYRLMEQMAACGKTRKQIAEALEMSYSAVTTVFKQTWFKNNVIALLKENGADHVKAFLQAEAMPSLEVVREIRDDCEEKGATRLAAANTILDRLLGKPTNKVEVEANVNISNVDTEAEVLLNEAKALDEKLKARGISIIPNPSTN